jgi:hypothetical protein
MNQRALLCVAIALMMFGCSKKPDTAAPAPAPQPTAAAAPTPAPQPSAPAPVAQAPAPTTPATPSTPAAPATIADLPTDTVTSGLKEALGNGLQSAVANLGKPGGFLSNPDVKIPMPDKLKTAEGALQSIGQGAIADQFVTTMNTAAEQAVPAAAGVFADSLKSMTVDDAKKILAGPDDAATQYFRKATEADLTQKFLPIVQKATAASGATAAYKQILDKAKSTIPFFSDPSFDLDNYVTSKALDGLFTMVAAEEKRIRANPAAQSSALLQSVFGALKK